MVQEHRQIIITSDELIVAFKAYARMTPGFFPEGEIVECQPMTSGEVIVVIESTKADGTTQKTPVELRGLDLLRPVVRFCIENNVILPREGKKTVIAGNGVLILDIRLHMETDMVDFLNPMRLDQVNQVTG